MRTELDTVNIKPMSKKDLDGVIEIESKTYGTHHWSKESFMNELNNELAYYYSLYTSDGYLAGYAGTWHVLDEAHITNISVHPDYRRKKVGESLLHTAIEDCYKNGIKYITLEVRVSNIKAIGLYEKYGFKSLGTRKQYYQDNNEDALIMWTENIFYDKFKSNYEIRRDELKKVVNIL